jgi:hypothetical protein
MPGKCASRGLLPICPTIIPRLTVLHELKWFANMHPIAYSPLSGVCISSSEEFAHLVNLFRNAPISEPFKTLQKEELLQYIETNNIQSNIYKYVGEFY